MMENPGDDLYFGEVMRRVIQDPWQPKKEDTWYRTGLSTRGWRPTQRGIYVHSPTYEQSFVRQGFSQCAALWRTLPDITPEDLADTCRKGKDYWWDQKQERGVTCSYYDLFMRYCMRWWLDHGYLLPTDYPLTWDPSNQIEIQPGQSIDLTVICGTPPFTWQITGTGFSLSSPVTEHRTNTLKALDTGCGTATITVKDSSQQQITGTVRSTAGQWNLIWTCGWWETAYSRQGIIEPHRYEVWYWCPNNSDWKDALPCYEACPEPASCEPPGACPAGIAADPWGQGYNFTGFCCKISAQWILTPSKINKYAWGCPD